MRISIDKLQKKCGSKQERKHFMRHMRETEAADHMPDYRVMLEDDFAIFLKRETEAAQAKGPLQAPAPDTAAKTALSQAADRPTGIFISSEAIEKVREIAHGVDIYWLEESYRAWAMNLEPARNEDARFLKWAPNFIKSQARCN